MSRRNGDRARFQKDRQRKLLKRQRLQRLLLAIKGTTPVHARPQPQADKPSS
jgi:hypothetical protein